MRRAPRFAWAWPAAAGVVAAAVIAAILLLYGYQRNHREAAVHAQQAELAASDVNALDWEALATGRVPGDAGAHLSRLRASVLLELAHQHTARRKAAVHAALDTYVPAVREELRLVGAGQVVAARRFDSARVNPAYGKLGAELRVVAAGNVRAADAAQTAATAGEITIVLLGLAGTAFFAARFAAARRALAAAENEQRVLAETSKAKSNLISVVSHDLRTPLTSIVGYLEILREGEAGAALGADQRRFLDIIQRNANRLLSIVDDLLFISGAQENQVALSRQPLSLADAAGEAVDAQRLRARAHEVSLRLTAEPAPKVMADRARVDELIENLLSNAIKFTPRGGSVRVSVGLADGRARLEVADSGVGISPDDQEHIFERFFRSSSAMGMPGTGLGLAIVKAIADAHGAAVTVASAPGEGATFRVDFPPSSPQAGE